MIISKTAFTFLERAARARSRASARRLSTDFLANSRFSSLGVTAPTLPRRNHTCNGGGTIDIRASCPRARRETVGKSAVDFCSGDESATSPRGRVPSGSHERLAPKQCGALSQSRWRNEGRERTIRRSASTASVERRKRNRRTEEESLTRHARSDHREESRYKRTPECEVWRHVNRAETCSSNTLR